MSLAFRVIDTDRKKVVESQSGILEFLSVNGILVEASVHSFRSGGAVFSLHEPDADRYKVQRLAGSYKDKDGNHLWEGDIVDCFSYGRRGIAWSDEDAAFILRPVGSISTKGMLLHIMDSTGMVYVGNMLLEDGK